MIFEWHTVKHIRALLRVATGAAKIHPAGGVSKSSAKAWWEIAGILLVTIGGGAASVYVILSSIYDDGTKKWAAGLAGSIVGYWLR